MNVWQIHQDVQELFEDVAKLVWRHALQETPCSAWPTGVASPTNEEIDSVKRRALAVQESLLANIMPFRVARDGLTNHDPLIYRPWLSWHEWLVDRCLRLLREISGESGSNLHRDDVFDETIYANSLAALTEEANVAAEMFPTQEPASRLETTTTADSVSLDDKALAVKVQHPDWTDQQVADEIGCTRETLFKQKMVKYKQAKAALRAGRQRYQHGDKPDRRRKSSHVDKRDDE